MYLGKPEISRVTRSKAEAKASYDKLSGWYDILAGWSEKEPREIALQKLGAREGERILEIGFGTGHGLQALAQSVGRAGKVYGIDLSAGMLRISRQRLNAAGLSERVELHLGDAGHLPFDADSLDAIFMSFTLELFDTPEIPVVLRECQRVLRPGGRACIVAMSKLRGTPMTKFYEWLHRKFPRYVDCRPIFLRQAVAAAGFHIAETMEISLWGLVGELVLAKKG
ncbi:MAG: class I SAM-dependent methyltransferase [Desulfobaccales bacterium]